MTLLLLCAPAFAATDFQLPNQKIITDDKVDPGETVVIKVSPIDKPPSYLKSAMYTWKVFEDGKVKNNVTAWPDGSSVFFGSGIKPGKKFLVVVACSYYYEVPSDKDNKIAEAGQNSQLLYAWVVVTGDEPPQPAPNPQPGPNPNPNPTPTPTPDLPAGQFNLAQQSYGWAQSMVTLPPADRARSAQALAAAFDSTASAISAGTLRDIKSILTQTKQNNDTALQGVQISPAAWQSWNLNFQKYAFDLYKNGKLRTPQDFAIAWREVAAGLNKVK